MNRIPINKHAHDNVTKRHCAFTCGCSRGRENKRMRLRSVMRVMTTGVLMEVRAAYLSLPVTAAMPPQTTTD